MANANQKVEPVNPTPETAEVQTDEPPVVNETKGNEITMEGLLVEIQQLKADNARLKTSNDKIMSENGGLRKSLRAKQTAEEAEAEEKAKAAQAEKERVNSIERELAVMKATNRYMKLGMTEEDALQTATDEIDKNMDAWTASVGKYLAKAEERAYTRARSELLKEMPVPQSGNGSSIDYEALYDHAVNEGDSVAQAAAILKQGMEAGKIKIN